MLDKILKLYLETGFLEGVRCFGVKSLFFWNLNKMGVRILLIFKRVELGGRWGVERNVLRESLENMI